MTKILIADKLSEEAEKIFLANDILCDIKTGLSENEIISSADIRKELFQGDNIRMRNDPTGPEDENKESGQGDGAGEGESETTPSTSTDDKE